MSSFRKQFQRVRQNIDQNLGRAEKTEVLTEDELNLERKVDLVKNICQNIQKKIQPCLRSLGQNNDLEKRMKKLPETGLSHTLIECSVQFDQSTPLGTFFTTAAEAQGMLAQEILKLDLDIESTILKPYHNILENDYPSVQRHKKQLNTRTLDMDAAKNRYLNIMKQVQSGTAPSSKADELRNEMEEAVVKLEQVKDQWAIEMYNFSGKEIDICQSLLELIKVQAEFHKRSFEILEGFLPQLSHHMNLAAIKPAFGLRLEEHLEGRPGEIATVIEECIKFICGQGLEEEGLLRLTGPASKIKKLKSAFNVSTNPLSDTSEDYDVHSVACSLKQYLRELPEPLMQSSLFADWTKALEKPSDQVAHHLKEVVSRLEPKEYYVNLRYVIKFLKKLSDQSDINKMTPANIGVVMGPNLIWPQTEPSGLNMMAVSLQSALVEAMVIHCDTIFPGASEFDAMLSKIQTNANLGPANEYHSGSRLSVPPAIPEVKGSGDVLPIPASNTLRKGKKQPAPQPPLQETIGIPQMFPNSNQQEHPPSPRVEKPRVPPPERPNIPPPDKPQVADRPRTTPPAVPNSTGSMNVSPPVNYSILPAITQPLLQPLSSQIFSQSHASFPCQPQVQPMSYPYQQQPQLRSSYPYQPSTTLPYLPQPLSTCYDGASSCTTNVMSASMTSLSQASCEKVVTSSTSTSCITSSFAALPPAPLQPPSNSSNPKPYPTLEAREASDSLTPSGPKGHSRQHSIGSKPAPPQRPHPPVPPKKVEMRSTDF